MKNKLWFKRKRYGWGWTPSTKEGWYLIVGYFVIFSVLFYAFVMTQNFWFFAVILFETALFLTITYKKGETPKWQWGEIPNSK